MAAKEHKGNHALHSLVELTMRTTDDSVGHSPKNTNSVLCTKDRDS